jgi:uncharacterized membrane protein
LTNLIIYYIKCIGGENMSISECKKEALSRLKGNWGKAIGILVAYIVFNFLITIVVGIFENNALLSLVLSIA